MLLIDTTIGARTLSEVLKSLEQYEGLFNHKTPSHTSCRRWINQVGYYMLEIVPVEQASDWIFIVDNSIRMDNRKLCVVLGVKRSQLKKGQSLSFKDIRLITMRLVDKNKKVETVLEEAINKAGKPISICSDLGPDVMPSIKAIMKKYKNVQHIPDMTHKAGNMLKKYLEKDAHWNEFITNVNQSKNRLKQSSLCSLCPPNVRGQSRFLNCKDVMDWALRIIEMLESMDQEDPDYEVLKEKLGWAILQKEDIKYFFELFELAALAKELTRKLHIDKMGWIYAKNLLKRRGRSVRGNKFADELIAFLKEQGEKVGEHEGACLLGCSEIVESVMSKVKFLDKESGTSGFTRSVLGLAACLGPIDRKEIEKAFENVNEKDINAWAKKHIGQTIQSKRRKALKNLDRTKLEEELERFIESKIKVA